MKKLEEIQNHNKGNSMINSFSLNKYFKVLVGCIVSYYSELQKMEEREKGNILIILDEKEVIR
jgi:hypothetical protein